jgi:hypothetical protein
MKFFKKKDIWILAGLLLAAAIGMAVYSLAGRASSDRLYAEIYHRDALVKVVYLDEEQLITLPQHPEIQFEVKDGAIAFVHSDCPDKVCIYTGPQGEVGGFAACLPNQTMFWVDSEAREKPGSVEK